MTLRVFVVIGGVVCGALGVFLVFGIVYETLGGRYGDATHFVGMAEMFLGLAFGARKYGTDRISPRAATERGGTTFWSDRELDISFRLVVIGLAITLVTPRSESAAGALVFAGLVLITIAVTSGPYLRQSIQWWEGSYLRLTPEGVELRQWLRVQSCTWDQVTSVTNELTRAQRRTPSAIVLRTSGGKELWMWGRTFTPNGTALRDLVRFYWRYPEVRGELTDGAAQRRLEERLAAVRR